MYVRTYVRVRHASGMSISNALGMPRKHLARTLYIRYTQAKCKQQRAQSYGRAEALAPATELQKSSEESVLATTSHAQCAFTSRVAYSLARGIMRMRSPSIIVYMSSYNIVYMSEWDIIARNIQQCISA